MVNFSPLPLIDIFVDWLYALNNFWSLLNSPFVDVFADRFGPVSIIVRTFLSSSNYDDLTVLEFMLGIGLSIYLVWQLCTWFLNLIT